MIDRRKFTTKKFRELLVRPTTVPMGTERRREKVCDCCERRGTYFYFTINQRTQRPAGYCLDCYERQCYIQIHKSCPGRYRTKRRVT